MAFRLKNVFFPLGVPLRRLHGRSSAAPLQPLPSGRLRVGPLRARLFASALRRIPVGARHAVPLHPYKFHPAGAHRATHASPLRPHPAGGGGPPRLAPRRPPGPSRIASTMLSLRMCYGRNMLRPYMTVVVFRAGRYPLVGARRKVLPCARTRNKFACPVSFKIVKNEYHCQGV